MKILIVEGNSAEVLDRNEMLGIQPGWQSYRDALMFNDPWVETDVAFPYDREREIGLLPLESYDGFALTGSGVSWGAEDVEAKPYLEFVSILLETGRPVLGSCWGMQTVSVLLGGMSGPNPAGSEIGVAKDIELTHEGRNHYLFEGMPDVFDSPCIHRDHVTRLPEGAILLASNAISPVQAMAYTQGGIDYAGFQFHPETRLEIIAEMTAKLAPLPGTVAMQENFPEAPPETVVNPTLRTKPIANWLKHVRSLKQTGKADTRAA